MKKGGLFADICMSKTEGVCRSMLVDDDAFSHHQHAWNLLSCLNSDESQNVHLSWRIQQTLHFQNQQSHSLPAARTEVQLLSATWERIIIKKNVKVCSHLKQQKGYQMLRRWHSWFAFFVQPTVLNPKIFNWTSIFVFFASKITLNCFWLILS